MSDSVRFDRAAEFYDRSRSISDEAMARHRRGGGRELRGRGRVLEVGVGTGLLALPLHEAGIEVVGLDLSAPMLGQARREGGRSAAVPAGPRRRHADAVRRGAFGAAYLRWVLHLIPDWRGVLDEVVRVVDPGGVFLANLGAYGGYRRGDPAPVRRDRRRLDRAGGAVVGGFDELDAEMAGPGAHAPGPAGDPRGGEGPLAEFLDGIDENRYSWTWPVAEDVRRRAAAELRPWAAERFGPLDEPGDYEHATVWRVYDLP